MSPRRRQTFYTGTSRVFLLHAATARKVKEGETTNDLFAFLTTEPNSEVCAIHPKAMPVILTTPAEVETSMTGSSDKALKLQRPLSDGTLKIVARGVKEDGAELPTT